MKSFEYEGVEYRSMREFCRMRGLSYHRMRRLCRYYKRAHDDVRVAARWMTGAEPLKHSNEMQTSTRVRETELSMLRVSSYKARKQLALNALKRRVIDAVKL